MHINQITRQLNKVNDSYISTQSQFTRTVFKKESLWPQESVIFQGFMERETARCISSQPESLKNQEVTAQATSIEILHRK